MRIGNFYFQKHVFNLVPAILLNWYFSMDILKLMFRNPFLNNFWQCVNLSRISLTSSNKSLLEYLFSYIIIFPYFFRCNWTTNNFLCRDIIYSRKIHIFLIVWQRKVKCVIFSSNFKSAREYISFWCLNFYTPQDMLLPNGPFVHRILENILVRKKNFLIIWGNF